MPTVDLPQGHVNYRVSGPADSTVPPVVFIHGALVNSELWAGVAAALAERGIRGYLPELPLGSHTVALNPDADNSPRGVARLVLDFLEALGLTDVTLVGNDTGGAICQFVIDTDSSRIGRLVLTDCDCFDQFPPPPADLMVKLARSPFRLRLFMAPLRWTAVRHSRFSYGGLTVRPLDAALTRRWVTPLLTDAAVRRDAVKLMRGTHPADLLAVSTRLGSFTRPVLVMWGTGDKVFKLSLGRRLADAFPGARLVEVDGGRAFHPLDDPDRVASEISGFLAPSVET
jgi:pimeloyl-ACP methyl ester carboxylesterase